MGTLSHFLVGVGFVLFSTVSLAAYSYATAHTSLSTKTLAEVLSEPIVPLDLNIPEFTEQAAIQEVNLQQETIAPNIATRSTSTAVSIDDTEITVTPSIPVVPFYSQFTDISYANWQKVGCGIASLAMLIDYHKPAIAVDTLLEAGIESGAYISDAGWSHQGLIDLAKKYGLDGSTNGLSHLTMDEAFHTLTEALIKGPVMVSVHYTFEPTNPIPHLVVLTGVQGDQVYYNDPAEITGGGSLSISKFQKAWKKRYIEIHPTT